MVPAFYKFSTLKRGDVVELVKKLLDRHLYKYQYHDKVSSVLVHYTVL